MKKIVGNLIGTIIVTVALQTHAQGTMIFDQESSNSPAHPIGDGYVDGITIQTYPLAQSFIPSLSAIDFVEFEFEDPPNSQTDGATVYVNLLEGNPNPGLATLLASTAPVYMPNGFVNDGLGVAGVTNFYFSSPVTLTPGQTYYLEPVVQSGDNPWAIVSLDYDAYPSGELFANGLPGNPTVDLWFREGTITPEPSTLTLIGLGGLLILGYRRRKRLVFSLNCIPREATKSDSL